MCREVGIFTFLNLVFIELLDGVKMALVLLEANDDMADVILNSLKDALELLEVILIFEILFNNNKTIHKRKSRNLES